MTASHKEYLLRARNQFRRCQEWGSPCSHFCRSVVPHIIQPQQENNNGPNDFFSFLFGDTKRQSPHVEIPSVQPVCAAIGYPLLHQPPPVCLVRPQPTCGDRFCYRGGAGRRRKAASVGVFWPEGGKKKQQIKCAAIKCAELRNPSLVSNFPTNPPDFNDRTSEEMLIESETRLVLLRDHNDHHHRENVFHPNKINPSSALPLLTANFTLLFHFNANKLDKIQSSDSLRLIHSDLLWGFIRFLF